MLNTVCVETEPGIESAPTWFTVQLAPDGTSTAAMVNDENGLPPPPAPPHSCSAQAALREAVRAQPVQQLSLESGVRPQRPAAAISAPSTAQASGLEHQAGNVPRLFGFKDSNQRHVDGQMCGAPAADSRRAAMSPTPLRT